MGFLQRLMYGRYGPDQLGMVLMALYLLLYLLSCLVDSVILSVLSALCAVAFFWRLLSKKIDKRRAENARFLELVRPVIRWYNVNKCRRADKDHCYFKCPNCGQQLRVPKGKGKLSVTCRNCGVSFEKTT